MSAAPRRFRVRARAATELELANATGIRELAKIRPAPDVRMVYVAHRARPLLLVRAGSGRARIHADHPPTPRPLPRGIIKL